MGIKAEKPKGNQKPTSQNKDNSLDKRTQAGKIMSGKYDAKKK